MSEHTPGPWKIVPVGQAQSRWIVGDAEGGSVADCEPCGPWMRNNEADANARLIAAAPDLLEALKECLLEHGGYTIKGLCESRARAAIAKAEGKP